MSPAIFTRENSNPSSPKSTKDAPIDPLRQLAPRFCTLPNAQGQLQEASRIPNLNSHFSETLRVLSGVRSLRGGILRDAVEFAKFVRPGVRSPRPLRQSTTGNSGSAWRVCGNGSRITANDVEMCDFGHNIFIFLVWCFFEVAADTSCLVVKGFHAVVALTNKISVTGDLSPRSIKSPAVTMRRTIRRVTKGKEM